MMLVRAASDLEIEAEMMSPRDAEGAVDASGSPEGVLQSPRCGHNSQRPDYCDLSLLNLKPIARILLFMPDCSGILQVAL